MKTNKSHSQRFVAIDAWRGFAVVGMIVYHGALMLDFFGIVQYEMHSGWWHILARTVQVSFLMVVGVSLVISFKGEKYTTHSSYYRVQLKRAAGIGLIALVITVSTWYATPAWYIRFGILHLITAAIIISLPLVTHANLARLALVLSVIIAVILDQFTSQSFLFQVLGANYPGRLKTMDFFPLFPWYALIVFSIVCSQLFLDSKVFHSVNNFITRFSFSRVLAIPGRHSLKLYVLHVPILLGIFMAIGLIDFYNAFPSLR